MNLRGNLDCEARWAGVDLPAGILARISLLAPLFAACAPDDEHQIWVPAAIDPARLLAVPGWTPPTVHVAPPAKRGVVAPARHYDLAWAAPDAAAANDRSRTHAIAEALGVALPGARVVDSLEALDAHAAAIAGPWVCKARWTAAGRDRAHGQGPITGELRNRLSRLLARFGALVFEPWMDRLADLGVCGEIRADGAIALADPHQLRSDPRGGFVGIDLAPPALDAPMRTLLDDTARAAARRLAAETGYRGPFTVDAFVYRGPDGAAILHPLCELNARHTFGWIARAFARRLGTSQLGFDAPPPGARVLIAPGDDRVTAWCA